MHGSVREAPGDRRFYSTIKMLVESVGKTIRVSPTFFQRADRMTEGGKLSTKGIVTRVKVAALLFTARQLNSALLVELHG